MCKFRNSTKVNLCLPRKYSKRTIIKVDKCIAPLVQFLNDLGIHTLGSCCGHGKYNTSIIIEHKGREFDIFRNKDVRRLGRSNMAFNELSSRVPAGSILITREVFYDLKHLKIDKETEKHK